jgi:hypothetical protein
MSEVLSTGRPSDLARHRLGWRRADGADGDRLRARPFFICLLWRERRVRGWLRCRGRSYRSALATRKRLRAPLATLASPGAPDIPALSHPVHTTTY